MRTDILLRAVYYGLLKQEEIDKYSPHFLMFGRYHVETVIHTEDRQWMVFNQWNFKDLYNDIEERLDSFYYSNKIPPMEPFDMIYPDRGIYSNLIDPIPKELFLLGLKTEDKLDLKQDLSTLIFWTTPSWMSFYSNLRLFRYNNGYEQVSLREIRKVEGYDDYENAFNSQYYQKDLEEDYSMYKI